jgi:ABC-type phosphate/phosphonate transport system substrate-binding protein
MNTFKKILFASSIFILFTNSLYALEHGEVSTQNGTVLAWDKDSKSWTSIEEFWRTYALKNGGLTWKDNSTFPPYEKLQEFDLFMAKNEQGICLLEFFHTRWRRANDVRRWDDKFNEYSACPTILN